MKRIFLFLIIFLGIFFFVLEANAALLLDVSINEIDWMGGKNSGNDEWIELYNNTDKNISLDGWVLKSQNGKLNIKLNGEISAKDFYLMERTNDDSVLNIKANLIYSGALANNGEDLKLYDKSVNLIDEVSCASGWFFGDNTTKQTMEKINPAIAGTEKSNWQTSKDSGGTPKTKNSEGFKLAKVKSTIDKPAGTQQLININYPDGIIINEILPSPEGADETNEYIELYNKNNFDVNLSGWKLRDAEGTITTFIIPKDTKILANSFLLFKRPETKISLNNSGDSVNLILPDDKIINSVSFTKSPLGQSYNLTSSGWPASNASGVANAGWAWSKTLSPSQKNIITQIAPKTAKTALPKIQNSDNSIRDIGNLASLSESLGLVSGSAGFKNNPWFLFLIAISITIISAIIVLIFKLRFGKKDNSID